MRMPKLLCAALILALPVSIPAVGWAQFGGVTAPPAELQDGFDSITPEKCKKVLNVLAGPTFEGRGSGQIGYTKAASWVAGQIAMFGLEPVGDGDTFFQSMPVTRRFPDMEECKVLGPNGFEMAGKDNFGFERFTDQAELSADVVFVRFSGDNPAFADGVQLRDKIVIYSTDEKAAARAPRMLARQRPQAAIRIIDGTPTSTPQVIFEGRRRRSTSVSGTISEVAAVKIAEACNVDMPTGNQQIAQVVETKQNFSIRIPVKEKLTTTPNVVGLVEGSDPALRHEYVVIGAHLDHLGRRGGAVYYGADDNGSGSTALLTIAQAMMQNKVKPKRSVLFIWFAAEEVGLIGSRYYTQHPLLPVKNMTCMLNIDMVGRNEETSEETSAQNEGHIHLVGSRRGESELHDLIIKTNQQHIGFEFEYDEEENVFGRSDQINFYRLGVPVAFLFGGFHPDYHQSSDSKDKINYNKVSSAARLVYLSAYTTAEHGRFKLKPSEDK